MLKIGTGPARVCACICSPRKPIWTVKIWIGHGSDAWCGRTFTVKNYCNCSPDERVAIVSWLIFFFFFVEYRIAVIKTDNRRAENNCETNGYACKVTIITDNTYYVVIYDFHLRYIAKTMSGRIIILTITITSLWSTDRPRYILYTIIVVRIYLFLSMCDFTARGP